MFRRVLLVAFTFAACGAVLSARAAFAEAVFESGAPQAVLLDAGTGATLYQKNARVQVPPSSMTKLMTVYVIFDQMRQGRLKPDDTFTVSENAWRKGGSKMFVKVHEAVKVADLLQGIVVQSGNDACVTVAEGIASSEEAFAEIMNAEAQKIGLQNSHFLNASGWPEEGHHMSVYDIALLSLHLIREFPEQYKLFSEREFTYNGIRQMNRNKLLALDIGADGLKTGHTEDGGFGMAASAIKDGRRLVAVVNGTKSDRERTAEAEKLLQYGFRYFVTETLAPKDAVLGEADVWLGSSSTVKLKTKSAIVAAVPKAGKAKAPEMRIEYEGPLDAPIKAGDKVAELRLSLGAEQLQTYPLYAAEDVEKASVGMRAFKRMYYYLMRFVEGLIEGTDEKPAEAPAPEGAIKAPVSPAASGEGTSVVTMTVPAGPVAPSAPASAAPAPVIPAPAAGVAETKPSPFPTAPFPAPDPKAEKPQESAPAEVKAEIKTEKQQESVADKKRAGDKEKSGSDKRHGKGKEKEKEKGKSKEKQKSEDESEKKEGVKQADNGKEKDDDRMNVAPAPRPNLSAPERQPDE